MQSSDLTIQQVIDQGDNSLTITGTDADGNSYETGMGRKSDLPTDQTAQMAYYQQVLLTSIPPQASVLYQDPSYTPPEGSMQAVAAERMSGNQTRVQNNTVV